MFFGLSQITTSVFLERKEGRQNDIDSDVYGIVTQRKIDIQREERAGNQANNFVIDAIEFNSSSYKEIRKEVVNEGGSKYEEKFLARKMSNGNTYLYKYQSALENWSLSIYITIGHLFNNIVRKILLPIILSPLLLVNGDRFKKIKETLRADWENLMPIKAIAALILNAALDLLSVLTFCVASSFFNKVSGDVERWAVGDILIGEEKGSAIGKTYGNRITKGALLCRDSFLFDRYVSPCQQPMFVLDKSGSTIYDQIRGVDKAGFIRWMKDDGLETKVNILECATTDASQDFSDSEEDDSYSDI